MSSSVIEKYLFDWQKNKDYSPKLVADLTEEHMVAQPASDHAAPANHAAWVFCHLNVYLLVIQSIIRGEEFPDPKEHPFGMLSKPESSREVYVSNQQLVDELIDGHAQVAKLLCQADDSVFDQQVMLSRWKKNMPSAAIALPYLMSNHENGHLGQLSA